MENFIIPTEIIIRLVDTIYDEIPSEKILEFEELKGYTIDMYLSQNVFPRCYSEAQKLCVNLSQAAILAGDIQRQVREKIKPLFEDKEKIPVLIEYWDFLFLVLQCYRS